MDPAQVYFKNNFVQGIDQICSHFMDTITRCYSCLKTCCYASVLTVNLEKSRCSQMQP